MAQDAIPYGYCQCGCGQQTTISPYTSRHWGWTKGEPRRYRKGHAGPPKLKWSSDLWDVRNTGFETECWLWNRAHEELGYGRFSEGGVVRLAHVLAWEKLNGPVPDGYELDHLCRMPACIRPIHLESVSHQTNIQRGRNAKLSHELADEIRDLRARNGLTHRQLAIRYGVSTRTISHTLAGKRWIHDCSPSRCA